MRKTRATTIAITIATSIATKSATPLHRHLPPLAARRAKLRGRGFTLVELMVTLAVLAILTAVAYPSFVSAINKGRRSDAISALTTVQQVQERWRANNPRYSGLLGSSVPPASPDGLNLPSTSSSGYYAITLAAATETSYETRATAVTGKAQAGDGVCKVMGVQVAAGTIRYASGASAVDFTLSDPDPGRCWAR